MSDVYDQIIGAVSAYADAMASGLLPAGTTREQFGEWLGGVADALRQIEGLTATASGLPAGSDPTVSYNNGVLSFGIPKGDKGDGIVTVNVSTLPAGSSATASYDASTETLSLGIPKGDKGDTGATGNGIASIAKTETSGNVDTYTITYTNGNSTTFTVTNGNVSSVAGKTGVVTLDGGDVSYSDNDTYASGTVGKEVSDLKSAITQKQDKDVPIDNANQLASNTGVQDKVPYGFRATPEGAGNREQDKLVGGTVAWNQILDKSTYPTATGVFTDNGDGSITANGTTGSAAETFKFVNHNNSFLKYGHVYFIESGLKETGSSSTFEFMIVAFSSTNINLYKGATINKYAPINQTPLDIQAVVRANTTVNNLIFKPYMVDLTAFFGSSTIADYVYALEQATSGSGVAWLKKHFPQYFCNYNAYNAGSLDSVSGVSKHIQRGFNQWDEEWEAGLISVVNGQNVAGNGIRSKNMCKCVPNTIYHAKVPYTYSKFIFWYDANGNFISAPEMPNSGNLTSPDNAYYFRVRVDTIVTYNHDICINFHYDGSRDGEYQPYQKAEYALDDSLTLRGIPKLDANNKLYFDGDEYLSDGTHNTRFVLVNLAELAWSKNADGQFFASNSINSKMAWGSNHICNRYITSPNGAYSGNTDKSVSLSSTAVWIKDSAYTSLSDFKDSLSGAYLIYESATPTTSQADPFTNPQWVDNWGTEEFVTTSPVPVGHDTFYPTDQVKKLDGLPSDFSTLIAPTEKTYKATQAYAVGSYVIVNNILYKVTSSISNGATITPGTNCQATTLTAQLQLL